MTAIEWTDRTWNPVTGCDRTSPGCDNCYALTMARRLKAMGQPRYQNDGDPRTSGPGFKPTCHPDALEMPMRWRKPSMVFVNSMSDLFHVDVPQEFIAQAFSVMEMTPQHTYQVLTKRAQRMAQVMNDANTRALAGAITNQRLGIDARDYVDLDSKDPLQSVDVRNLGRAIRTARAAHGLSDHMPWPLPNMWLGVSVENDRYTFRADHLRVTPAVVRFLSCEPLLGSLPSLDLTGIDWVIVGAESGHGARPMNNDWALEIIEKADAAGCAVFVKQLYGGTHAIKDLSQFPLSNLRRREYPAVGGRAA